MFKKAFVLVLLATALFATSTASNPIEHPTLPALRLCRQPLNSAYPNDCDTIWGCQLQLISPISHEPCAGYRSNLVPLHHDAVVDSLPHFSRPTWRFFQ